MVGSSQFLEEVMNAPAPTNQQTRVLEGLALQKRIDQHMAKTYPATEKPLQGQSVSKPRTTPPKS